MRCCRILWPASAHRGPRSGFASSHSGLLNIAVIWRGIETIKFLEGIGAPFMLGVGLLLLWWITSKAGGLGPVLSTPSKFQIDGGVYAVLHSVADGDGGFLGDGRAEHSGLHALRQIAEAQMLGQAMGLPTAMTLYSFIGVAVTSASVVMFGQAIWDPVVLLGRFNQPVVAFIALDRAADRDAEHQCGGERRLAVERFFQPESAPDFVSHRRN